MGWKNKLYLGNSLQILRECVPHASVDLIYLDPAFNFSATYNVLLKEKAAKNRRSSPSAATGSAETDVQLWRTK
jgi:hypothetical protein